ncbi:hypothetical protein BTJ40_06745 [Microbulbifer sp. A4B17]|uniref:transposase n=1 Tax=Microbulbifer sp. A4B17 TaxID=359370 RepID=UPI000D52AD84|nr:hypothetical protein BTJ40_06745 [Microbulbifer sp. A4B17]
MKYYCRYHVVFVYRYQKKALFGTLRRELREIFRDLCRQMGIEFDEGSVFRDYIS